MTQCCSSRCKIIKISPEPEKEKKDTKMVEDIPGPSTLSRSDSVLCSRCWTALETVSPDEMKKDSFKGWDCKKCGTFNIAPNKAIDLSDPRFRNFDLVNTFGGRKKFPAAESRFDEPCPNPGLDNISKDPAANAWVFNHLPLSEEQKEDLLIDLHQDYKDGRLGEVKKMATERKTKTFEQVRKERSRKPMKPSTHREGVKSQHLPAVKKPASVTSPGESSSSDDTVIVGD